MVHHADFFDEPQRVVEREEIDKRSQANMLGALCYGGEKQRGRGCHAEGRGVVLREVVPDETSGVGCLQELQPLLIELL